MRRRRLALLEHTICRLIGHRWRIESTRVAGTALFSNPQCTRCLTALPRGENHG